jgi:hypothetical protein
MGWSGARGKRQGDAKPELGNMAKGSGSQERMLEEGEHPDRVNDRRREHREILR